jgi:branched-subunit amino acid aminotransferase/4-amino-4-deoxychorismate lyase
MPVLWCNGDWMEKSGGLLWPMDRGSMFGLSIFETILAIDGEPKLLPQHLNRFQEGHCQLGWELAHEISAEILRELLVKNYLTSGRVRIRITATAGAGNINDLARGKDALTWIYAHPAPEIPESITATLSPWKRNEQSPLAGLKCGAYAENLIALDAARKAGFDETIFFNTSGQLCEAAISNIFIVRDARILTPPLASGCLPGITRAVVLRLAEKHGLICKETPLEKADLENADEIFLTSAIRGPIAVSRLDGRLFRQSPVAASMRQWWLEEICGA